MGLDIEWFIETTVEMPAFRPVFNGEEERSHIMVHCRMVCIWGINNRATRRFSNTQNQDTTKPT